MNTNRGRKRRTEHERDSIREFNALVREHSEDALQNILRLSKYADDENVIARMLEIKAENKKRLAAYMQEKCGVKINPQSVFDIP